MLGLQQPRSAQCVTGASFAQAILDALLDSIDNPLDIQNRAGGRPRQQGLVKPRTVVVVQESHQTRPDDNHKHAALRLAPHSRFLPFELALRVRHGLASHWSTSHTHIWSAVRYIAVPTESKPQVDTQPLTWTSDGSELNLFEAAQEPWSAQSVKRRCEAKALQPSKEGPASKKGKTKEARERFGRMDLVSLILAEGLLTPCQVMAYVQEKGSAVMQAFVVRQQRHLKEILQEATEWQGAKAKAAAELEADWAIVERRARQTCSCGADGCVWWAAAESFFAANAPSADRPGVDRELLAATLRSVIQHGPSKIHRVPCLLGPTNSGKSTLIDPVRGVWVRMEYSTSRS